MRELSRVFKDAYPFSGLHMLKHMNSKTVSSFLYINLALTHEAINALIHPMIELSKEAYPLI